MSIRAPKPKPAATRPMVDHHSEILILPDGKILAHNLTPAAAGLLAKLNPLDRAMRRRAKSRQLSTHEFPN
jgi:hypothetical protein